MVDLIMDFVEKSSEFEILLYYNNYVMISDYHINYYRFCNIYNIIISIDLIFQGDDEEEEKDVLRVKIETAIATMNGSHSRMSS